MSKGNESAFPKILSLKAAYGEVASDGTVHKFDAESCGGLTKREYAAIQLMANLRSSDSQGASFLAAIAVRDAEALLAELEKQK